MILLQIELLKIRICGSLLASIGLDEGFCGCTGFLAGILGDCDDILGAEGVVGAGALLVGTSSVETVAGRISNLLLVGIAAGGGGGMWEMQFLGVWNESFSALRLTTSA